MNHDHAQGARTGTPDPLLDGLARLAVHPLSLVALWVDGFWHADAHGRLVQLVVRYGDRLHSLLATAPMPGPALWDGPLLGDERQWDSVRAAMAAGEHLAADGLYWPQAARWYALAGLPRSNADGHHDGYAGILRDVTTLHARDAALRESEQRFRTLTALASDWYWEQDEQFRFVSLNGNLRAHTGIGTSEHIGKTRWELPLAGVTPEAMAAHRATLEAHQPFRDFEFQRPLPNGGHHWVSISGNPVFGPDGSFRGYCGVGRNIDRAKRAELALHEANAELSRRLADQMDLAQRLELALDGSGAGTWSLDLDTRQARFDARWFALLGMPPDTVANDGGFFDRLVHPDDLPRVHQAMKSHLTGINPVYYCEMRMRHRRGDWVWIGTRGKVVARAPDGRARLMAGTHMDIGAAVALREEKQRQTAQLQALIDSAQIGMSVFDVDRSVYMNQAYANLLGYDDVAELQRLPIDAMVLPQDRARSRDRRQRVIAGERLPPAQLQLLGRDGRAIPVLASVSPVQWEGLSRGLSIVQAAGDRDLLAVQLDTTRERYNRLLSVQREQASARAVRDLRDSLGSDVTGVSLLLAALRARVEGGTAETRELLAMIDSLQEQVGVMAVNSRRIAHGLMPVVMDAGGLPAALEHFAGQVRAAWELQCELEVDEAACPPSSEACTQLFRIVQEAARNAVRHGDAQSMRVSLRRDGARGVLHLEDDGCGFNADAALAEENPGTGLRTMMALAAAVSGRIEFTRGTAGGAALRVEFELD